MTIKGKSKGWEKGTIPEHHWAPLGLEGLLITVTVCKNRIPRFQIQTVRGKSAFVAVNDQEKLILETFLTWGVVADWKKKKSDFWIGKSKAAN